MKVLVIASAMDCPSEVSASRSSTPFIDRAPVEEALRLRECGKADEVVILAVGNVEARILLLLALGMGVDRAALVQIEDRPSAEEVSALATAVAKREHPDLILLSQSSGDILAKMSLGLDCASTAMQSILAQHACRYPNVVQIRKAVAKQWDIIAASELR